MSTSSANGAIQLENELIERLKERPMRTDLTPIKESLSNFTRPDETAVVQVVGSNGKGSVIHYLSRLLNHTDHHVVSYTSPHFHHPLERFRINGRAISPDRFRQHLSRVNDRTKNQLTPFETLLLVAVDIAESEQPDYLLLEAGMGGRWDATSVLKAQLTVLTGVELEHAEYLGDTRPEIAREKTAQIPEDSTLITGPLGQETNQVIEQQVRRKKLSRVTIEGCDTAQETMKRLAARTAESLTGMSRGRTESLLNNVDPPIGRLDHHVHGGVEYLLDVGHTPEAIDQAINTLANQSIEGEAYAVFGCLAGKEADAMLKRLLERIPRGHVLLTEPPSERAFDSDAINSIPLKSAEPYSPSEASTVLNTETTDGDVVLVAGSFDLVGWFLDELGSDVT